MTRTPVFEHSSKPPEGGSHDTATGMEMNPSIANIQPSANTSARKFALVVAAS